MLDKGSQCLTLVLDDDAPMQTHSSAHAAPTPAVQAAGALRQSCCSFLVVCADAQADTATCAAANAASTPVTSDQLMPGPKLNAMLHVFQDRFS